MHHCETKFRKKFWEGRGTTPCLDHPAALAALVYTLSYTFLVPSGAYDLTSIEGQL